MRIAFITPTLNIGGYEKVVVAYANELFKRGNNVDILCCNDAGKLEDNIQKGIRIINYNTKARKFLKPLAKYLKDNKPDILYSAFREYNCISVIAKQIAKSNTCIYATQHGFQEDCLVLSKLKGLIIKQADRLIAVADEIADYESQMLSLDRKRFIILNNPVIDTTKEIKEENHLWFKEKENIPIIVMAGRLAWDKGMEYGIDILKSINRRKKVRMLYLGDGPELKNIKKYAKEKGVDNLVDFLGFVDNPIGYMKNCNVFLHTALVEGFGNVLIEALYAGLPICTTNCSGPLQIIDNNKYGVNIGSVKDKDFAENASKIILNILNGDVVFTSQKKRALDFSINNSSYSFLEIYNYER